MIDPVEGAGGGTSHILEPGSAHSFAFVLEPALPNNQTALVYWSAVAFRLTGPSEGPSPAIVAFTFGCALAYRSNTGVLYANPDGVSAIRTETPAGQFPLALPVLSLQEDPDPWTGVLLLTFQNPANTETAITIMHSLVYISNDQDRTLPDPLA